MKGATQTNLQFLPEHATDFAFASLAEQRGFLGAGFLLMLYLFVVWRGLKVIAVARDSYSAIVAGGIVFAFLFQVFVNVGMTIGIAPVTGIPLPMISVGGSSMVRTCARSACPGDLCARPRPRTAGALVSPGTKVPIKPGAILGILKELRTSRKAIAPWRSRARASWSRC